MSTKVLRAVALTGAAAYIAEGALELVRRQHEHFSSANDYLIEATFAAGLLMTLAGLLTVHLRQERDLGALGGWSFRVAFAGQGMLGVLALATLARGHDVLGPLFALSVLAWTLGTIGYAIATARARVLPRWLAPALALGTIAGIVIAPGGTVVLGLLWLAIGAAAIGARHRLRPA